ncbi:MAG: hypothetical protein ACR2RF_29325 [Geminicoccaceae bacterium]
MMRRSLTAKARHIVLCLPLFGLALLLPPAIRVFAVPAAIMGVPLIVIYVFGIWAALIIGAAVFARHLVGGDVIDHPAESNPVSEQDSMT